LNKNDLVECMGLFILMHGIPPSTEVVYVNGIPMG